jgi:hypothetical protein
MLEDRSLSVFGESPDGFPKLPILSQADLPALNQREKYGGLFYLGIGGLLVLVVLVGWFSYSVWAIRDVFTDVYLLHDATRPEAERARTAFRLTRNANLNDTQLMQMSLERDLPGLARYLLAEAVSTDAVANDPRTYAVTVARSPDWPDWLRLLLMRRLAYGASRGYAVPRDSLEELARHADPMIGLWATYALANGPDADPRGLAELEKAANENGPRGELAAILLDALRSPEPERETRLDRATVWLRRQHPQAAKIWKGWDVKNGRLVQEPGS